MLDGEARGRRRRDGVHDRPPGLGTRRPLLAPRLRPRGRRGEGRGGEPPGRHRPDRRDRHAGEHRLRLQAGRRLPLPRCGRAGRAGEGGGRPDAGSGCRSRRSDQVPLSAKASGPVPAVPGHGAVPPAQVPHRDRRADPPARRGDPHRHAGRERSAAARLRGRDEVRERGDARGRGGRRRTPRSTPGPPSTPRWPRTSPTPSPPRSRELDPPRPLLGHRRPVPLRPPPAGRTDEAFDYLIVGGEDHKTGQADDTGRAVGPARGLGEGARSRRSGRSGTAGPGRCSRRPTASG